MKNAPEIQMLFPEIFTFSFRSERNTRVNGIIMQELQNANQNDLEENRSKPTLFERKYEKKFFFNIKYFLMRQFSFCKLK